MNARIQEAIRKTFRYIGLDVRKYDRQSQEAWDCDDSFKVLFKEIKSHTIVSQNRCFMLYQLAKYASLLEGEIAEVGVYKGGTGKLIAKTCLKKKVYLFDTFSGMPKPDPTIDCHKKGDFSGTSLEAVRKYFRDIDNIVLQPGFFPDSSDHLNFKSFCFIHIYVDIYH